VVTFGMSLTSDCYGQPEKTGKFEISALVADSKSATSRLSRKHLSLLRFTPTLTTSEANGRYATFTPNARRTSDATSHKRNGEFCASSNFR
jgi:hypothetical protein